MPIKSLGHRPISHYGYTFYDELIKDETFTDKSNIWGIGLLLGYILKRRTKNQPTSTVGGLTRIMVTYTENKKDFPLFLETTNFIFDHYAVGADEKAKLKDLDRIADGGIEYLMEEKEKLGAAPLDISKIIQKVKQVEKEENSTT